MSVLPDSSIWIAYLRWGGRSSAAGLDPLLDGGDVMVCGPVVAEVLTGTSEGQQAQLWGLLSSLPWADLGPEQWRMVGDVSAALRVRGLSLPLTDVEIAVAAVDVGAQVWTSDKDFHRIQQVLPDLRFYGD